MAQRTRASEELNRILSENQAIAEKLREKFPRSTLSRLRHGYRKPGRLAAMTLQKLTGGRVSLTAWDRPAQHQEELTCQK